MKRVVFAVSALLLFIQPLFSQGIQSSIVNLPLTGNWRQAAEIEKDGTAPGVQVFYDQNTGTVLQIRNDYQIRGVTEISQQFHGAGSSAATPEGAKILMMAMFPLPSKYLREISPSIGGGRVPKLWEVKEPGNAEWFYTSQLFGGYRVTGAGNSTEVREEYIPLKVTLAENRTAGTGDALLFEALTEHPAPEAAIRRFKLPPSLRDQNLRYGWIQFSPGGLTSSESIISIGFATPVNSGIDVKAVLAEMVKNTSAKVEAKN